MSVDSVATHEIAGPAALVNVSIRVDELAIPAGLVAAPGTAIRGAIRPLHFALAMAHTPEPLPDVLRPSRQILVIHPLLAIDEVLNL